MNQNLTAWRDEFLKRKKKNEERAEDVAQRLVNIYRQLYIMDEQTTQRYNALLLETATDEILTALKSIPGGEEIREYYAFLKKVTSNDEDASASSDEDDNDTSDASFINMTLPKAEELSPLWQSFGSVVATGAVPVQAVPVSEQPVAAPVTQVVTQPPVVKTVYVEKNVMLDADKLKGDMSSLLSGYQDQVLSSLKNIVIDSDIEKMHQNIKKAIEKVQQEATTTHSALEDLLSSQDYLLEDESARKKGPSQKQLNKIKNRNHKYAVDMDEGDFS